MSLFAAAFLATHVGALDVHPPVTVPWLAAQLVPSPELAFDGAVRVGARWQVTPLLYSWGRNRAISGFRAFMVEPTFRHSGAVELWVAPEIIALPSHPFLVRGGVRAYFPVVSKGETLTVSLASAWYVHRGAFEPGLEVGAYALAGLLGVQVTHSPMLEGARAIVTLCVRVL